MLLIKVKDNTVENASLLGFISSLKNSPFIVREWITKFDGQPSLTPEDIRSVLSAQSADKTTTDCLSAHLEESSKSDIIARIMFDGTNGRNEPVTDACVVLEHFGTLFLDPEKGELLYVGTLDKEDCENDFRTVWSISKIK